MKEVPFNELEVGVIYVDIDDESSELATTLHLVKKDEDWAYFKYVSGNKLYLKNRDGLIWLANWAGSFYLPTTDQSSNTEK